jgi:hypothetical protein
VLKTPLFLLKNRGLVGLEIRMVLNLLLSGSVGC